MATYDFTRDGNGSIEAEAFRRSVCLKVNVKVSEIIASDSTLTSNGVIAANDIIKLVDVPAGFFCTGAAVKTVTPEGAALTADLGLAGGVELATAFTLNGAAGSITSTAVDDGWGPDNMIGYGFSAADTIDMQFLAETDEGEWNIYLFGFMLD